MLPTVTIAVKRPFIFAGLRRKRGDLLLIGLQAAKFLVDQNIARRIVTRQSAAQETREALALDDCHA